MTPSLPFFLLRASRRISLDAAEPPVVDEGEQVQFELLQAADAEPNSWRLRFGDLLPERPGGIDIGDVVRWERGTWFDSCRGQVQVSLERNPQPDAPSHGSDGWELALRVPVLVRPSKITEDQWSAMRADLEAVAVDLASDLVGKASAGLERAVLARSPLDEVNAARRLLNRLQRVLVRIAEQPHAVLRASPEKVAKTPRRLDGPTIKRMLMRGLDPRRHPTMASSRFVSQRLEPSFDVLEHRQILGALRAVASRLGEGARRAEAEIMELEADRSWRQRPDDAPGTSLYDRFDRPRIQRLGTIAKESALLQSQAQKLAECPLLSGITPQRSLRPSLVSRHVPPYWLAWRAITAWNALGRVQVDGGEQVRRKDTARMYEQWVFLQLAAGLRFLGFHLDMEEDVFRQIRARRFLMDLPRGAGLSFARSDGARLGLHFEPWIRPRDLAVHLGDIYFHGRRREAAWSPDIVLTFEVAPGARSQGVVLDAKYTKRLHEAHWSGVQKYFQIRRLSDGGQAIDQVWLAAPGVAGIRLEDDSITWTSEGPDMPVGAGTIQGEVGLAPTPGLKLGQPIPQVVDFLTGLLARAGFSLHEMD